MTTLSRFEIHQPASVAEASQMLGHYGDEAAIYAGGTELLLAMRHRALSYSHLVDLKVIPGLNAIEARDGVIEIGSACTHRTLERSTLLREKQPVFAELESQVANIRVRATGTLGGNLCFAEPHSDPATMLLVLGATVRIENADGAREIPIEKLIAGAYSNHLAPGEILTRIVIPAAKPNHRAAYMKFQIHERPTLGLGLWLETPDRGRTFRSARVAVAASVRSRADHCKPRHCSQGRGLKLKNGCPKPPHSLPTAPIWSMTTKAAPNTSAISSASSSGGPSTRPSLPIAAK